MEAVNTTISPEVNEHNLALEVVIEPERLRNIEPGVVGRELFGFELANILLEDVSLHKLDVSLYQIAIAFAKDVFTKILHTPFQRQG
jgi:hypothetical protein